MLIIAWSLMIAYKKLPMPDYGPDLSEPDLKDMLYYQKMTDKNTGLERCAWWSEEDFDRLGVQKRNVNTLVHQHSTNLKWLITTCETTSKNCAIFTDTDTALREYPELFKKWFGKLVKPTDNKFVL